MNKEISIPQCLNLKIYFPLHFISAIHKMQINVHISFGVTLLLSWQQARHVSYHLWTCKNQKIEKAFKVSGKREREKVIGILSFSLTVPCSMRDLSPQPGIEPVSPAVEVQSPNHWTAREFPLAFCLIKLVPKKKKEQSVQKKIFNTQKFEIKKKVLQ